MRYFMLLAMTTVALSAADGVTDAERIAANAMRDRARMLPDPLMARALTDLAKALEEGRTNLTQARATVDLIAALPSATTAAAATRPQPSEPTNLAAAGGVTDLLDRDLASGKAAEPAQEKTAESAPDPSAVPEDTKPEARPAVITASVLAMREGGGDKPTLIMIDKGADASVRMDQSVRIVHDGATVVKCKIVQVKATITLCQLLTDTWAGSDRTVKEGDQAVIE
jgi:hypothetical protein